MKKQKREKSEIAKREASVTRGHSRPRDPSAMGLHSEEAVKAAQKLDRKGRMGWHGGAGEGDNRKSVHLVKWMNTGKKVRIYVAQVGSPWMSSWKNYYAYLILTCLHFSPLQRMGTHNKR